MVAQIQAAALSVDVVMATTKDCLDVQASTSASDQVFMAGDEGDATIMLVKFLISRNISLDVINDSHFQTLLKSVAQHGQRSCTLLENSTVIQKSLWKFEHEMKEYMLMVTDSWKMTGCTLMLYNLKEGRGVSQSSPPDQNKLLLGFYCPKGFIFEELPPSKQVNQSFNYYEIGNALKNLVPDSSLNVWSHVIRFVQHGPSLHSECHYHARDLSDTNESIDAFITKSPCTGETKCIRQQVLVLLSSIYNKSEWVRQLLQEANDVYQFIISSEVYGKFAKKWNKKEAEQVGWGKDALSLFSRLHVVLGLQLELKAWISQLSRTEKCCLNQSTDACIIKVENSYPDSNFWERGNDLLKVFAPFLKILSLVDTLAPTAGYIQVAMKQVRGLLITQCKRSIGNGWKYRPIWEIFEKWRAAYTDSVHEATGYLNPAYMLRCKVRAKLCAWCLYDLAEADEDPQALDSEIKAYNVKSSNPFANVSIFECDANHPVTLWSKYGGGFPLLQKCAYKLLSQPACCLCNQVRKHISKVEGLDNYVLRLNALMMEEFTKMGDGIYQPIHI